VLPKVLPITAAAAVYAADRLPPRKHLTQQAVADAASPVVATSRTRLSRDNCEFVAANRDQHSTEDPGVSLDGVSDTLC